MWFVIKELTVAKHWCISQMWKPGTDKKNLIYTNMWLFKMPVFHFLCRLLLRQQRHLWWCFAVLCLQKAKGSLCEAGAALPLLLCTQSVHVALPPGLWYLDTTASGHKLSKEDSQKHRPSSFPKIDREMTDKTRSSCEWFVTSCSLPGWPARRKKRRGHSPDLWVGEGWRWGRQQKLWEV